VITSVQMQRSKLGITNQFFRRSSPKGTCLYGKGICLKIIHRICIKVIYIWSNVIATLGGPQIIFKNIQKVFFMIWSRAWRKKWDKWTLDIKNTIICHELLHLYVHIMFYLYDIYIFIYKSYIDTLYAYRFIHQIHPDVMQKRTVFQRKSKCLCH